MLEKPGVWEESSPWRSVSGRLREGRTRQWLCEGAVLPSPSVWMVQVHKQPGSQVKGQSTWSGKASPGSDTSAGDLSNSALAATRRPHLGKARLNMIFCNTNLYSKDKAHWMFSHSVTWISTEMWGDKELYGVSESICSSPNQWSKKHPLLKLAK